MGEPTRRKRVGPEKAAFGKLMAAMTTMRRRDPVSEFDCDVYEGATARIPLAIVSRAVAKILQEQAWFPTVHDLLQACEAVRVEMRAALKFEPCAECAESPGYRPVGKLAVERCVCWHAHQARVKALGLPEEPLALPAASEGEWTTAGEME